MTDTAHIYHPQSDSLEDRIAAFCTAHRAYKNAEASIALMDDPTWADRLGSREDMQAGLEISERSLKLAAQGMTISDVEQAKRERLLSQEQMLLLVQQQRQKQSTELRHSAHKKDEQNSSKLTR